MAGKVGMKHYSIECRHDIVNEYKKGCISRNDLCEKYGIHKTQLRNWSIWVKQYGIPKQLTGKQRGRPHKVEETLEMKIKRLEMENTLLKKFHELLKEESRKK